MHLGGNLFLRWFSVLTHLYEVLFGSVRRLWEDAAISAARSADRGQAPEESRAAAPPAQAAPEPVIPESEIGRLNATTEKILQLELSDLS